MEMKRRDFMGAAVAAGIAATAGSVSAQDAPPPARRGGGRGAAGAQAAAGRGAPPAKTWTAKVERLWNIPSFKNMNALEATPEGLWIGDQVSEKSLRIVGSQSDEKPRSPTFVHEGIFELTNISILERFDS